MIYDYHFIDKNYDQLDDTAVGYWGLFKVNTSSSSHTMPIWVINSSWADRKANIPPSHQDWVNVANCIATNKSLISNFLYYQQKNKDGKYYIDHRPIGVYKQSPKCYCGQTPYPDWFVTFLQSDADLSLIPATAPKSKPILKRK